MSQSRSETPPRSISPSVPSVSASAMSLSPPLAEVPFRSQLFLPSPPQIDSPTLPPSSEPQYNLFQFSPPRFTSKHALVLSIFAEKNVVLKYAHIDEIFNLARGCKYLLKQVNLTTATKSIVNGLRAYDSLLDALVKLDDYSIMEILQYLDVPSLIRVSLYHTRLMQLTKYKIKHLKLKLDGENKNTKLCQLFYLLDTLKLGQTIKKLEITFGDVNCFCCPFEVVSLIQMLIVFIDTQLEDLTLNIRSINRNDKNFIEETIQQIRVFPIHIHKI